MFKIIKNNPTHQLIMEQIVAVEKCMNCLESFVRAACAPDSGSETLRNLSQQVAAAEADADTSLRRMIDSLGESTYLPSTREELISIASSCDEIANICETFAARVIQQRFRFPSEFTQDILQIIQISHNQFDILETSISQLFSQFGKMLKDHSILNEIRACESQVDDIERSLYERIFGMDLDLAHQMQINYFIDLLCDIADTVEDIADKIQIMLVTRKA